MLKALVILGQETLVKHNILVACLQSLSILLGQVAQVLGDVQVTDVLSCVFTAGLLGA